MIIETTICETTLSRLYIRTISNKFRDILSFDPVLRSFFRQGQLLKASKIFYYIGVLMVGKWGTGAALHEININVIASQTKKFPKYWGTI